MGVVVKGNRTVGWSAASANLPVWPDLAPREADKVCQIQLRMSIGNENDQVS